MGRDVDVARRLADAVTATEVLDAAAEAMHARLGMTVVVNVREMADDEFVATRVIGGGAAAASLLGERYAVDSFLDLYVPEYLRPDGLYLIPADSPGWESFEGAVIVEQAVVADGPDAWRPGDHLEAVLRDRAGEVLAVIVADNPADGRTPGADVLASCAVIGLHAASALEARLASADAAAGQREAEELQHLSAALAAGLGEQEILARAAEGLCLSCGFRFALIALYDETRNGLRCVAGAGQGRRAVGAPIPAAIFEDVMVLEHRVSDSYLVPLEHADGIAALELHHSTENGAGVRAWKRDTLVLPLSPGVGETIGVIWVDDPVDRLLPSADKVRRMELFARNAALMVTNARLLAAARDQATRDPLTGLGNARAFAVALAEGAEGPVTLALVDVDRFKEVNDREGHLRGDAALRQVAVALEMVGGPTTRAFRLGGDEFAILCDGIAGEDLAETLDLVRGSLAGLSFSAGVAESPRDAQLGEGLVHAADTALYAAKRGGRGRTERFRARRTAAVPTAALSSALERVALGERDVVASLLRGLAGSLGASSAAYWEHDVATGTAVCREVAGDVHVEVGAVVSLRPIDRRRQVIETGRPTIVHGDDLEPEGADVRHVRAAGLSSMAIIPVVVAGVAIGHLELGFLEVGGLPLQDLDLAASIAAIAGIALERQRHAARIEEAYRDTLEALGTALDSKDAATGDHARALAALAGGVARRLGLDEREVREIEYVALFHDIGKIATPTEVLRKPGPLTPAERRVMERHVIDGARIVEQVGFLRHIAPSVRHSHERFDGAGYPHGLAGDQIPLASRIVFACDTLHAMTSNRPYRAALPIAEATAELRRVSGTQLDPLVVDALLSELAEAVAA
jgi:diguanylate cyclase (GGDEF)-like protein/putative nucleotidyltransferase with HDIG domain